MFVLVFGDLTDIHKMVIRTVNLLIYQHIVGCLV